MLTKRGDIADDQTPPERTENVKQGQVPDLEEHTTKRLADAATETCQSQARK